MMMHVLTLVTGLLFIVLGVPPYRGKVRPNMWYGLRTEETLADPAVWYRANRAAGRDMVVLGAVLVFASAVLLALGDTLPMEVHIMIGAAVLLGTVAVFLIRSLRIVGELGRGRHP